MNWTWVDVLIGLMAAIGIAISLSMKDGRAWLAFYVCMVMFYGIMRSDKLWIGLRIRPARNMR